MKNIIKCLIITNKHRSKTRSAISTSLTTIHSSSLNPSSLFFSLSCQTNKIAFSFQIHPIMSYTSSDHHQDQELKHRNIIQEEEEEVVEKPPAAAGDSDMNGGVRRQKKTATAKRGLRTLGFAICLPVVLTLLDIYFFGSNLQYATMKKSILYPPLWALHLSFLGSAFLMGLSSWLVWADGGFHKFPYALVLYLCQLALGLAWDPIVFKGGASRVGLMMCVALFGTLAGCIKMFRRVNPIASDLIKPTLFWALLLTLTNIKLVHP